MRAWHFTEMPYPNLPPLESLSTMRVSLPNSLFDPKIGADLYNRYLDEYMIADDLGLDLLCGPGCAGGRQQDAIAVVAAGQQ